MVIISPFLCFSSVVCLGVFALACDGVYALPAAALCGVELTLLLLGKLFIGYEFFHIFAPFVLYFVL